MPAEALYDIFGTKQGEAPPDIPSLIRGRWVALVGRPASMNRREFLDLLGANGAKSSPGVSAGTSLVVVGQRDWPPTQDGVLRSELRKAHNLIRRHNAPIRIVSEDQFLSALGLDAYRQNVSRLYPLSMLAEILGISADRIRAWVATSLIRPVKIEYGVWYFDFRSVCTAKTLWELVQSGVSLRRLRVSLEQLRRWLPEAQEPLEQLAVIEGKRQMLIRMEEGALLEPDGQLHFDFTQRGEGDSLKLIPGPRTAYEWFEQGAQQELQGYLAEAAESYRHALLSGGPDADVCFSLANVLAAQGKKLQAMERYFQAVELRPDYGDVWNNLGLILAELGRPDDACFALRKAIACDPNDSPAHYNLADVLDESGKRAEAIEHWRAYLRLDGTSKWAAHARKQLSAS